MPPRGGRKELSREVKVSKALSLILRHAAEKEGIKIDNQGYANVGELVCRTWELMTHPSYINGHAANGFLQQLVTMEKAQGHESHAR